jgi:nicotinamidase-related amidase
MSITWLDYFRGRKGINMKPALVVIDMQPFFFRTDERKEKLDELIVKINELIEFADENSIPVYHVKTIHKRNKSTWNLVMRKHNFGALFEGTAESKIIPEIIRKNHHKVIVKTRQSTFIRTNFEKELRDNSIDTVILSGVFTHGCVGRTAIDAYELDFNVILAIEASFSHLKNQERVMLEVIKEEQQQKVLSNKEIIELLKK